MHIKMTTSIASAEWSLQHGDIVDVTDEVGRAWIADGMAEAAPTEAPTAKSVHEPPPDAPETADPVAPPAALPADPPAAQSSAAKRRK